MSFRLFGIPNCDTVKKARTFLEKKKIPFEFVDFKKSPPDVSDIERWKEAFLDFPVNTKGTTYKKFKDEFENLSPKEKLKFLTVNSSMIKRPILEKNNKVIAFGFSEDEYKKALS